MSGWLIASLFDPPDVFDIHPLPRVEGPVKRRRKICSKSPQESLFPWDLGARRGQIRKSEGGNGHLKRHYFGPTFPRLPSFLLRRRRRLRRFWSRRARPLPPSLPPRIKKRGQTRCLLPPPKGGRGGCVNRKNGTTRLPPRGTAEATAGEGKITVPPPFRFPVSSSPNSRGFRSIPVLGGRGFSREDGTQRGEGRK